MGSIPRRSISLLLAVGGLAAPGCWRRPKPRTMLHVVLPSGPTSRDPLQTFDEASQLVFGNVVQTVMGDPLGVRAGSGVVEHWTNPDRSTWVLCLKKGLRFHDGRPVTARDVAASIERIKSDVASPLHTFVESIVDVTPVSDDEVKVIAVSAANILAQMAFIPVLPGGAPVPAGGLPVGSGPYRMVSWSDHRIILKRTPGAAGSRQAPAEVDFLIAPDARRQEAAARALRPLVIMAPREAVLDDAGTFGLRRLDVESLGALYLVCNVRDERPMASLAARRALAAICRHSVPPPPGRRWPPADDLVPSGVFGHVAGRFAPRPEWSRPEAVPRSRIRLVSLNTLSSVGGKLAACLSGAGWTIDPVNLSPRDALRTIEAGRFDVAVMGYCCASGSALELFEFGFSSHGGLANGANFSGYRNPALDAILAEASSTLDPAVEHDLLIKAGDMVVEELPWIPLFHITRTFLLSPSVNLPEDAAREMALSMVRIGS